MFLTSCDCYQTVNGTIVDSETGKPLKNISVFNNDKKNCNTTTDTSGYFKLSKISGGFNCPPMTIIVNENGYKKIEISIVSGEKKTIRLEKVNKQKIVLINQKQALDTIRKIFEDYVKFQESVDSDENKKSMTNCIESLSNLKKYKDLELLINIWEYYDPTDYSCRELILKVLKQDKATSIKALKMRIKNNHKWSNEIPVDFDYLEKDLTQK